MKLGPIGEANQTHGKCGTPAKAVNLQASHPALTLPPKPQIRVTPDPDAPSLTLLYRGKGGTQRTHHSSSATPITVTKHRPPSLTQLYRGKGGPPRTISLRLDHSAENTYMDRHGQSALASRG